jgi:hypothetical protein
MAVNTSPIYTLIPKVGFGTLTGNIAHARSDGVGTIATDLFLCFTADATDGSYVDRIRMSYTATTPTTFAATTVIRIYISSVTSGATTAANTVLFQEVSTAAVPAANATNSTNYIEIPCGFVLPPSYTILAGIHTNMTANTRMQILVFGGDYS